jgi:uncharacterized membrane protein (TIGR02234 family)
MAEASDAARRAAYAGHHHWISLGHTDPFAPAEQTGLDSPGTTALALVALAAWGVVLVTRGVVRRAVALLGALAAIAPVPALWHTLHHLESTHAGSHGTAWPWIALVGSLVSFVAAVVAVRKAPHWPEMGAKYDAPADAAAAVHTQEPLEEQSSLELWKSLDEGRDPTQDQDPPRD